MNESIPVSALEHYRYCPRQCALIHVDGVWSENRHTVRGTRGHRRVDEPAGRSERGRLVLRGVPIWSERLGLSGRCDAIEAYPNGTVLPVEHKVGVRHGDAADVQLCAQAMCLEEMLGVAIPVGFVWYSAVRRRSRVGLDSSLRRTTLATIEAVREAFEHRRLPEAADDERCTNCQLIDHCMPGVVSAAPALEAYMREVVGCAS